MNYKFLSKEFISDISSLGSGPVYVLITLIMLSIGYYQLAFNLLIAIILVTIIIVLVRVLFFKNRPKKIEYNNLIEKIVASSFPSHHSSNGALIFIIMSSYFNSMPLIVLLFVISLIIPLTRILLHKHFISDVVVGYALGIIIGLIVQINLF